MKPRIGRILAGATALAATALLMGGATASAQTEPGIDWDHIFNPYSPNPSSGARVYVEEYGDIISVCDTAKDGKSATVEVSEDGYTDSGYTMTVSSGYGTCKTHRASDGGKYNLDEKNYVFLKFWAKGDDSYGDFYNDH
ncbi:hypothetical protein [Streptomyces drozdowiczii]|uniref:Secreted protein n=1 Tax=Streptomyces drozdowiczii TaxID=202862 RepID=A0ABY6PUD9_9ACTN|nr:hypothetical protein [Streptomyces drozdowiczii]MCX0244367.1 hypothetical protein [Streptomyces drozdowiczii]UZK55845.1 hypothetical protein NEH16_18545 [Streptomyces drozdowiczii]